ncbi:MAG TPA: FtsQ-type POTRA domain-containing protein [Streptosporangiaceae bacterium]|nr:FtsQ-type POTRA domain-containing protein [Streptosporangiaceae bacterium]
MRWKAVFFGLAAVAIVAGVAWALLGSRLLVVRSVQVTGTGPQVSRAQVLTAARVRAGLPLIRVNTAAVAQRVDGIRQVQSTQVSRSWPSTVVISVRLRTPVFAVAVHGGYALVDAYGVDVRDSARRPPRLPLLQLTAGAAGTGGAAGLSSLRPVARAGAAVLRELPPPIARRVRTVSAPTPSEVSLELANGAVIVWGDPSRAAEKARELTLLMRTHARRYDVSAPGTAVTQG